MTKENAIEYIKLWCPYDKQNEIIEALSVEPQEWISILDEVEAEINGEINGLMGDAEYQSVIKGLRIALDAVGRVAEAYKHKPAWISVKDRLPEKNDCYLVTFNFVSNGNPDNGIGIVEFYDGNFYSNGFGVNEDVVAWYSNPVPSPYKGE